MTLTAHSETKQLEINGVLIFRNVFELCNIMINNNEVVTYGAEIKQEEKIPARLVFSRPVYIQENLQEEVKKSLVSSKPFSKLNEAPEELTILLDGFYHLKAAYQRFTLIYGNSDPSQFIADYLGTNYYDCMSGGMPTGAFHIIVALCQDTRIDKTRQVYPSGDTWSTLADFMEEASKSKLPDATNEVLELTQGLDGL